MANKVKSYDITSAEQLRRWVAGESCHSSRTKECVPDFSCCRPQLLQPVKVRREFARANESKRAEMCMQFLGEMLRHAGAQVVNSK